MILFAIFGEKIMMKFNAIFWSKEKPDKIIGLRVRLAEFDGLGPNPPELLRGSIIEYIDGRYRINLDEPTTIDGKNENYAIVSAKHGGYPVSRISKRGILAVGGKFESGRGFISLIAKR